MDHSLEVERRRLLEESQALEGRVEADEERKRSRLAAQFTVAERLMRRGQVNKFRTVFQDDLGDIVVETRQMTGAERDRTVMLDRLLRLSAEDPEKYQEAIAGFKALAAEVCVTPGLSEYLRSEDVSDDIVIALVMASFRGSMGLVGEALTSFRQE